MAYVTITEIWDGTLALEEDMSEEDAREHLPQVRDMWAAQTNGKAHVQVYALTHNHDMNDEGCECSQYAQDHRPVLILGGMG